MRRPSEATARAVVPPALALLVHLAVGAAFLVVPLRQPPIEGTIPSAEDEIAIDLVTPAASTETAPTVEPNASRERPADSAVAKRSDAVGDAEVATLDRTPESAQGRAAERAQGNAGTEVPAVPGGAAGEATAPIAVTRPAPERLVVGGANPFLPRSEAAVEAAEAKRAVDRALRDPARERERELGLGPEGPVLTALGDATGRSTAPVRGRAVFVASTNGAGDVVTLELTTAEGERSGWAEAGRLALAALQGKKLRLPAKTSRAVMRIEVTSAWKLPSGQDPGADVSVFGVNVAKGEGKDSPKVALLNPIPKIRVVPLSREINIPVLQLEFDLFATNSDPTNVGAKARRVIHSRLLDSQLM